MITVFHACAITVCAANVAWIAAYYWLRGLTDHVYVSDLLFSTTPYRVLLSLGAGLQIVFCLIAACSAPHDRRFLYFELTGLALQAAGWVTLITRYRATDNSVGSGHIAGTAIYITGICVNSVFILVTLAATRWVYPMWAITITGAGVGIGFIVGFYQQTDVGWNCEHWALMMVALQHLLYFVALQRIHASEVRRKRPPDVPQCVNVPIALLRRPPADTRQRGEEDKTTGRPTVCECTH